MLGSEKVLMVVIILLIGLIGISVIRRRQGKNTRIQSIRSVITGVGAVICLVSLFSPWVTIEGITYTEMEIVAVWDIAITQVVVYSLLFIVILQYFGSYLYAYGFEAGKSLISKSSSLFLTLSILMIIGLGILPGVRFEGFAPWIAVFGAIVGRTSLEVPKDEKTKEEVFCPSCGNLVDSEDTFCKTCGVRLQAESGLSIDEQDEPV